ncbi:MAG: electron transfer flavoprotein subunit beta/FixA family protein [Chloroflexota bacterium]
MNIAVCVKQVPDTTVVKEIDADSLRLDRDVAAVANPFDEYAVEEALRLVEKHGGTVTAVCVGPPKAAEQLRRVLAMGVDRAILASDPALAGSDTLGTARALAAALRSEPFDLILCGPESTDARTGVVPSRLAELLGLAQLTYARKVEVAEGKVTIERTTDDGSVIVAAALPALVTVLKGINEPRYPTLKGIMGAKKKELKEMSLAPLGLEATQVGAAGARARVLSLAYPAARRVGQVVRAEGHGGEIIADFLEKAKVI